MDEEEEHMSFNLERQFSEESTASVSSEDSEEDYVNLIRSLPKQRWQQKVTAGNDDHTPLYKDWDPSQALKTLPLCMEEKRNLRNRQPRESLTVSKWVLWKRSKQIAWRRLMEQMGAFFSRLMPWNHTLHSIEGRFGVGVKAYFVFLRYLLYLNLLNCVIITALVIFPSLFGRNTNIKERWSKPDITGSALDVFLGSGFVERSPVFYTFYAYKKSTDCLSPPFLFALGMAIIVFLSLIMIVRRTVVTYKIMWLSGSRFRLKSSYKVFCGWDFCIQDPNLALLKQSLIRNELKMDLEEQKYYEKVSQRSLKQRVFLLFLRILLNFMVVLLLGGSFILIHFVTKISKKSQNPLWAVQLIMEYLPPIIMTIINFVLPHLFCKISVFEDYFLTTQLNLTLVRSIFLKLASLGIYLFFLITERNQKNSVTCWETEFGKEMYKLTIFQFLACFCNAFFVGFPRALIVEKFPSSKLALKAGKQEFVIPLNVLDLVYSQTVTWVGVFYCPMLPAISILKLLCIFYMKKFIVVRCCVPAQRMFRTSSSTVLFNFTLLMGLIMSAMILGININNSNPVDCGPFHGSGTVFNVTSNCVSTLPGPAQTTLHYVTSEAFAFAIIMAEIIILTFFVSRIRDNRKSIERLKDILVMCSSDKHFLVKQQTTLHRRQKTTRTNTAPTRE